MEIKILYEDEYILALDKPSGLMTHPDGRSKEKTLTDWILQKYPELKDVGEEQVLQNGEVIKREGIVHRLDKDTSGVILVAKTKEAHQYLKEQFQARKVEKIYHAVVWGKFGEDKLEGTIDKPIGRSASDFRKWSAEYGAKGELREAVTEYKVLAQGLFTPRSLGEVGAYVEVRPKTGRTHQIRVHLKSIGHPVVGDKVYGGTKHELRDTSYDKKGQRLMLHAVSVKLELPNGTHIKVESALPEEFEKIKNFLNTP
jgi:23S rRNA pseudouridine1911/1915/1917 synthase